MKLNELFLIKDRCALSISRMYPEKIKGENNKEDKRERRN
jgi:hypothetical protein